MDKYTLCLKNGIIKNYDFIEPKENEYIVVAVARDENKYIKEWVEHYLYLGFDRIFIGDNNNSDDESLLEVLKDFINSGRVVVLDCRGITVPFQREFYNMFSNLAEYKWALYCDIDEFLELNAFDNIKEFLETKLQENFVFFRWVSYGNNGIEKYEDKPVQERFEYPLPLMIPDNLRFKTLVRGGHYVEMEIHGPKSFDYTKYHMTYRDGYMKHYKYKSLEEQLTKDKKLAYTNDKIPRRKLIDFSSNVLYHNDLINKYVDLRDEFGPMHQRVIPNDTNIVLKYFSQTYKNKDVDTNFARYFEKLFLKQQIICKDMSIVRGKYFLIDFACAEEDFNMMFEVALHTKNKVCMTMPKIKNFVSTTVVYL